MVALVGTKLSELDLFDGVLTGDEIVEITQQVFPVGGGDPYLDTFALPLSELIAQLAVDGNDQGALVEKGTWDASTNTPTLSDAGTGLVAGDFYVVSVAGTTTLGGISTWAENDWLVWNGTIWRKVDNRNLLARANNWTNTNNFATVGGKVFVNPPTAAKHPVNKQYFEEVLDKTTIANTSGNKVTFTRPTVWAASYDSATGLPTGLTGDIYADLTGALRGVIQKIYHNHTSAPNFPSGWVKIGGSYINSMLNIINCEFVATGTTAGRVEYWITQ